jgi:membrane protein DedA with SNARE-associated domain
MNVFKHWGTGTLIASTAIPLPTPTSMFFAAAGAGDYPLGRFLVIVATCRAVRYFGIAFVAAHYGRTLLRVLRHPLDHWGWLVLFVVLTCALVVGGVLVSRRLETAGAD